MSQPPPGRQETMVPIRRLGAASPGGLVLPDAHPTPAQLYGPRGVWFDDTRLIVADSGNHRVLIWHRSPDEDGAEADVVLGQKDFFTEGPRAAGRGVRGGLHLPTGICVADGNLVVADAWHHRVLVWEGVAERCDSLPAYSIGQPDLESTEPNRGTGRAGALGLRWPYGVAWIDGWLFVADTGNRRVLGWRGLPGPGIPPALVLGQPIPEAADENRGGPPSARSFRWPHAVAGCSGTLYVADAGNNRILGWSPWPDADSDATLVLGQPDFATTGELPFVPQGGSTLRFPYSVSCANGALAVGDTGNNRILLWQPPPAAGAGVPADQVAGQPDFAESGENRWRAVTDDALCWPYAVWLHGGLMAVADSGNNRVTLWALHRN